MDADLGRYPEIWAAAGRDAPCSRSRRRAAGASPARPSRRSPRFAPDVPRPVRLPRISAPGRRPGPGPPHPGRDTEPKQVVVGYPEESGSATGGPEAGAATPCRPLGGGWRAVRVRGPRRARFERLCRAELRTEGPAGAWAARLASPIFDAPAGLAWDTAGLLVVKYGFVTYGLAARTGALRLVRTAQESPVLAVLGSGACPTSSSRRRSRRFALEEDGEVRWRVGHSDVVAECELIGGRLVLTSYCRPGLGARPGDRAPPSRDQPSRRVDAMWTTGTATRPDRGADRLTVPGRPRSVGFDPEGS